MIAVRRSVVRWNQSRRHGRREHPSARSSGCANHRQSSGKNGMNLTGVESYSQKIVLGIVILGAVLARPTQEENPWRFPGSFPIACRRAAAVAAVARIQGGRNRPFEHARELRCASDLQNQLSIVNDAVSLPDASASRGARRDDTESSTAFANHRKRLPGRIKALRRRFGADADQSLLQGHRRHAAGRGAAAGTKSLSHPVKLGPAK